MSSTRDPSSRSRIPQACAECRRLKLKCDKKWPCSTCLRRGCASICPQGRMVSKGSRFILANTEQLHKKIDILIGRVHQLEDALQASHLLHSHETHPLLKEDFRLIATPLEPFASEPEPAGKEDEVAECMGTLTLDKSGTQYFGTTGAYALLWQDKDDPERTAYKSKGEVSLALEDLPSELADMAVSFPVRLPMSDVTHLGTWIAENCLPVFPVAWSLVENYWEHYAWLFTPITRTVFVEQILSPLYRRSPDNGDTPLGHRLGLLFMVFAIGDLFDLTQPWEPSRGLRYFLIARASLCVDPVLESPTVTALQAMHLIETFLMMSRGANEPEHAWVLTGINLKLALTLGLQHDASKFNLPPEEVENRKNVLTALLAGEVWQSLCIGRLPAQTFTSFDWLFKDQHGDTTRDSVRFLSPGPWVTSFVRDCTCKVLDTVVTSKVTSYSAILQLDMKIREYPSLDLSTGVSQGPEDLGAGSILRHTFLKVVKEMTLLYLHKNCFALALTNCPEDPLKSPFSPSVVACHRSAIKIVSQINEVHSKVSALTVRIWFIWPHVFVSTLILGSIVARSPGCSLAASSLLWFGRTCQTWESASESVVGGKVLEIVRQLKRKAFRAFAQNQGPRDIIKAAPGEIEILDEIQALGGWRPRVISTIQKSALTSSTYSSSSKPPSSWSRSTLSGNSPDDYIHTLAHNKSVDVQLIAPSAAETVVNPNPSMARSFDWDKFDYSYHLPTPSDNTLSTDFDVFRAMGAHEVPPTARPSTFLDELGLDLEGEWEPVMDDQGLQYH